VFTPWSCVNGNHTVHFPFWIANIKHFMVCIRPAVMGIHVNISMPERESNRSIENEVRQMDRVGYYLVLVRKVNRVVGAFRSRWWSYATYNIMAKHGTQIIIRTGSDPMIIRCKFHSGTLHGFEATANSDTLQARACRKVPFSSVEWLSVNLWVEGSNPTRTLVGHCYSWGSGSQECKRWFGC
jgi:hypothetical protein